MANYADIAARAVNLPRRYPVAGIAASGMDGLLPERGVGATLRFAEGRKVAMQSGTGKHAADIAVVGAGLAGLVAACEAAARGKRVILLDQEGPQNLGGQAFWSLGGLFMVDTPEQRRLRIRDSEALALSDWMGSAQLHGPQDLWPRRVAKAYIGFAAGEMRDWLHGIGMRWFPVVGWAERGGALASGHGNSVPRFHITWGTGPGVLAPFERMAAEHVATGRLTILHRHRVTTITRQAGRIAGVTGEVLEETQVARGQKSSRVVTGSFEVEAGSVVVTSGGIGGNFDRVRAAWPADRLGPPPARMVAGVPAHVDGDMIEVTTEAGAATINTDRMWHYCEGIRNWDPIWPDHGIRILPGPSSMWFDARGARMEAPCLPGFDTLATLRRILSTGQDHSWFVLTQAIIKKEFALSGSEQNPDFTSGKWGEVIRQRVLNKAATGPVEAFKEKGADFVVADTLEALVEAAFEAGLVTDGVIAQSQAQRADFWALREHLPEANRRIGAVSNHDISVPLGSIATFVAGAEQRLRGTFGDMRTNCFGHVGDGNLHYSIWPSDGALKDVLMEAVEDEVRALSGSFSAEHGIGLGKLSSMRRRKDPAALAAMTAIKQALDPDDLLNPGKLYPR